MDTRRIVRVFAAAALAATFVPTPAHALLAITPVPPKLPPAPVVLPKPAQTAHLDAAPAESGDIEGSVVVTEPPLPPLPVPSADGSGDGSSHVVDASSSAGSDRAERVWDGTNKIVFSAFDDGDMVVVSDPWSLTGHAGLFDKRYYSGLSSFAVWSANIKPVNGVQREPCSKYRANDYAFALWVPSEYNHRVQARNFAAKQVGKPYNILSSKTDLRSFYCSKVAWAAWRYTAGIDLDADGGYWVWPIDLVNSRYTRLFGYWN